MVDCGEYPVQNMIASEGIVVATLGAEGVSVMELAEMAVILAR